MQLTYHIDAAHEGRELRTFVRNTAHLSAGLWKNIKWNGSVTINGSPIHNARTLLHEGDELVLTWREDNDIVASHQPLSVVYEDEALLVVDKGPGMIIHPTTKETHDTLVNVVKGYYEDHHIDAGIHPLYRLDRNTTGLVVIAKSANIQYGLTKSHDLIYREYLALIPGRLTEKKGRIARPIGRKPGSIVEWMVRPDGKPAVTDYEVLAENETASFLKLHLLTGRTHQIRVHLASLGHPLLGDDLYGGDTTLIPRQALHAWTVRFTHPVTGKEMYFEAPLPEDMKMLLERLQLSGEYAS